MKKTKQYISILLSVTYLFTNVVSVKAIEIPTAPTPPSAPASPTEPSAPPVNQPVPTVPVVPSTPQSPSSPEKTNETQPQRNNESSSEQKEKKNTSSSTSSTENSDQSSSSSSEQNMSASNINSDADPAQSGNVNDSNNTGNTTINTGDANASGTIVAAGNENVSVMDQSSGEVAGVEVINNANGANSTNNGSVSVVENNTTEQVNEAVIQNNLELDATSGNNISSYNTNGDTVIKSGDSNVSGTAITSVNTNIDAVSVSEFNIADTHRGDYVLDFASNCISGCTGGSQGVSNVGNGSNSNNLTESNSTLNNTSFQVNDATVGNNLVLNADSGSNEASYNTNGDSKIETGDANISANSLTFANNNISGNVVYGVVNIYGDLVGDIIFPEEQLNNCCGVASSAQNSNNGFGSNNQTSLSNAHNSNTSQTNIASIENNLILDSNTGDNTLNGNTGGSSNVSTGDSNATAQVLNVANTNISGDNMWLVLINNAGQWLGKIMGSPESANYAGSEGTIFTVDPNGQITASNSNNGSASNNLVNATNTVTDNTTQSNIANIQNNLDLSANTGKNNASYNTGGNSTVPTGDANIVANLVNFVNNNISGGGKLFVTVVNVFGKWTGNFLAPGQTKESEHQVELAQNSGPVGGSEVQLNTESVSNAPTPTPLKETVNTSQASTLPILKQKSTAVTTSNSVADNGEVQGLLADASGDVGSTYFKSITPASKNKISINLAWFLLGLPIIGILAAYKYRRASA